MPPRCANSRGRGTGGTSSHAAPAYFARGEKPCNHRPSPAEENGRVESAVLAFVLAEHPDRLTVGELSLALGGAAPDFDRRDEIERAIGELAGAGLIHRDGVFIVPSRPALCFHLLEACW